ncbi:MAG: Gfo/Idh/MocA family oxidoreductase [Rhodothermia bacterium]|nr:MAG: Gfo/Idh/MocA family oxidoreductase [Rhodothermia bacterium]
MGKEIRIGQIGLGYWGKNLLRVFSGIEGCRVTHGCDQNESILGPLKRAYPDTRFSVEYENLLVAADVDAVVIATETPTHFSLAMEALRAGKHVFVEKPMAQTTDEARMLVKESANQDRKLMVGHLLLYHPAFLHVRDLIHNGDLGQVYYIYSVRVNLGIVRQNENAFESLAPHDISVALEYMQAEPIAVSAQGQSYLQPGVEDVAFALIHFEDGKIAHLHTSWLDPHKVRRVTVVGSRQMAVIDDVKGTEKVRLYDKGVDVEPTEATFVDYANAMTLRSGEIRIPKIDMSEPLAEECRHFIECIQSDEIPRSGGQNGLAVVRVLEAARESLQKGGIQIGLE